MIENNITLWILITIISSIISGVLGVIISNKYQKKTLVKQAKIETLKNFVGYRYDIKGEQFTKAINEIFIIFQDSQDVIDKLNSFHESVVNKNALGDHKLYQLFTSMCNDLKYDTHKFSETSFMSVFNVKNYPQTQTHI